MCQRRQGLAVCVGGISGVGKTELGRRVMQQASFVVEQVTGSSVVREVVAPATIEEFNRWDTARQEDARRQAIANLSARRDRCGGVLLVDGHFTLPDRTTGQVTPVFTDEDRAFYDALVLVHGNAAAVARQRAADTLRRRPEQSLEALHAHLEAEREELLHLGATMHVPLFVVADESVEERARHLVRFLQSLLRSREYGHAA